MCSARIPVAAALTRGVIYCAPGFLLRSVEDVQFVVESMFALEPWCRSFYRPFAFRISHTPEYVVADTEEDAAVRAGSLAACLVSAALAVTTVACGAHRKRRSLLCERGSTMVLKSVPGRSCCSSSSGGTSKTWCSSFPFGRTGCLTRSLESASR